MQTLAVRRARDEAARIKSISCDVTFRFPMREREIANND